MLVLAGCTDDATDGSAESASNDGLEVGTEAPDFRLKNQDQATIALSDYRGEKNVILVFYPLAFTPV
jgi:peroxiredoxin